MTDSASPLVFKRCTLVWIIKTNEEEEDKYKCIPVITRQERAVLRSALLINANKC